MLGVGAAAAAGLAAERVLGKRVAAAAAVSLCSAAHALVAAAQQVAAALRAGDLVAARGALPALVGRDVAGLDDKEIARAVVESLAENLSDAVVASALWALVAGAPGALAHRAANTLDAMVGRRDARYRRFGWASARLDDLLGWAAARLSALLVAAATPQRARAVWRVWHGEAQGHPSPNAGVIEGAFAAALDLRLGGTNRYRGHEEVRPSLGSGQPPAAHDIERAVVLVRRVLIVLELALVGTWLTGRLERRRPRTRRVARP
jgi:adenosylcobinamide-phosphate synthase